jgi:hypothetical protein
MLLTDWEGSVKAQNKITKVKVKERKGCEDRPMGKIR